MQLIDIILIGVIVCILGLAIGKIYRAKKYGEKCIGCPHAKTCGKDEKEGCS